jgi:hypothetical protein
MTPRTGKLDSDESWSFIATAGRAGVTGPVGDGVNSTLGRGVTMADWEAANNMATDNVAKVNVMIMIFLVFLLGFFCIFVSSRAGSSVSDSFFIVFCESPFDCLPTRFNKSLQRCLYKSSN